ncbi:hypothetical protein PCL_02940 [Purpureocillium lilacinum]|nr:hypothetical protein PCL_02940 [Purpureocillium lilacinum]
MTDQAQSPPKNDVDAKPACHPRAVRCFYPLTRATPADNGWGCQCAIQDCLTRNNYNEAKCQDAVKALYECCNAFYERYGDDASTPSCPKPSLLRLKMKQQSEGR